MIRANSEQISAIEHRGGVSLKAGAGSGKTFVLVEHVMHLLEEFISAHNHLDRGHFEREFSLYISGIVLMTFTKKAAGELSIRLKSRARELTLEKKSIYWDIINKNIVKMTVGTIHSFCFKLLGTGYFKNINQNLNILSEIESKNKIEKIINLWLEEVLLDKSQKYKDFIVADLVSSSDRIIQSFCKIFFFPELRISWKRLELENIFNTDINKTFTSVCKKISLLKILNLEDELVLLRGEFSDKKWFEYLDELSRVLKKGVLGEKEHLEKLLGLYLEYKGTRGPTKKAPEQAKALWEEHKRLKALFDKNSEDLLQYFDDQEICQSWITALKDLFDYIEKHYLDFSGFTFSDLEYYVLDGLKDKEVRKNIQKSFNYFIVDEFQDTSEVQFEILLSLVNNNFEKLFCVGDIKQAIYGFRGGEISIFKKFDHLAPRSLTLKNNFRSYKKIVEFNNEFFDYLFPLGNEYEGRDFFKVEGQNQIASNNELGGVYILTPNLAPFKHLNDKLLSTLEISSLEAQTILNYLLILKKKSFQKSKNTEKEVICVLYKKLAPLKFLVPLLIKNKLSFTAQIKIPFLDDPLMGIFKLSLEFFLKTLTRIGHDDEIFIVFIFNGYLEYLGINFLPERILSALKQFSINIPFLGTMNSFDHLIFSLGISSSNYDNTLILLEGISNLCFDEPEAILIKINLEQKREYSYEFQFGETPNDIKLMTTHGSKGLEFDHVILAGVHNNGGTPPSSDIFGSLPGSFFWKNKEQSNKLYKTPFFIFEKLQEKCKEFSENKRLLYVACTRAIKSLAWVALENKKGPVIKDKNSWINAFRKFEEMKGPIAEKISIKLKLLDEAIKFNPAPLFHTDNVGIFEKSEKREGEKKYRKNDWNEELACFSEISVTRLTTVIDCPRKFYLNNICKFEGQEFDDLDQAFNEEISDNSSIYKKEKSTTKNSMSRGSFIHAEISQGLYDKSVLDRSKKYGKEDLEAIEYACNFFRELPHIEKIFSEVAIKFSLFGYMLAGTPDLVIKKNNGAFEVWDFKTGFKRPDNEDTYWFQLYCYGYSLFSRSMIKEDAEIKLSLMYVDQKTFVSRELSVLDLKGLLYGAMEKTKRFDQVNLEHCPKCSFQKICHSSMP